MVSRNIFYFILQSVWLCCGVCFVLNNLFEHQNKSNKMIFIPIKKDFECKFTTNVVQCKSKNLKTPVSNFSKHKEAKFAESEFKHKKNVFLNFSEYFLNETNFAENKDSIQYLQIINVFLPDIKIPIFDIFIQLKSLEILNSGLQFIDGKSLTKNIGSTLLNLDLTGNRISRLSSETFSNMKRLTHLKLDQNVDIGNDINKNIFQQSLKHLKWLSLSSCNISVLNIDTFCNLTSLSLLDLSSNPLIVIPQSISKLPKLQTFFLQDTNLSYLGYDNSTYSNSLRNLYLDVSKKITQISDCAFCNFPKLSTLSLNNCSALYNIHENAFGSITSSRLFHLNKLNLKFCNISSIPRNLIDSKTIRILNIKKIH